MKLSEYEGMGKDLAIQIDPMRKDCANLLVIYFPKSASSYYPFVVSIAQGASGYKEFTFNGKTAHVVAFSKNSEDASRAMAILDYISGWKGIQIFVQGRLVKDSLWGVKSVLKCYLEACACNDWKAHCYKVIDDPVIRGKEDLLNYTLTVRITDESPKYKELIEIDQYVFPCNYLYSLYRGVDFNLNHTSSFQDQIQAGAVKQGCHWCPNFDEKQFRKIGKRTITQDVFD